MAPTYVALLRGINVGGRNIVPMADLRSCMTGIGARDVTTYIQSGNVLFDGGDRSAAEWTVEIEQALAARYAFDASIVLRSHAELRAIVEGAPRGFGSDPDTYRSDVLFLREPLVAAKVIESVSPREGVDTAVAGDGVVYFARLAARASQSRLTRIVSLPIYQRMTIRNWRTTTTLLRLLDER